MSTQLFQDTILIQKVIYTQFVLSWTLAMDGYTIKTIGLREISIRGHARSLAQGRISGVGTISAVRSAWWQRKPPTMPCSWEAVKQTSSSLVPFPCRRRSKRDGRCTKLKWVSMLTGLWAMDCCYGVQMMMRNPWDNPNLNGRGIVSSTVVITFIITLVPMWHCQHQSPYTTLRVLRPSTNLPTVSPRNPIYIVQVQSNWKGSAITI